jgi:predicted DNA-binding antitoxin AbrB/MazE fold protein
MTQADPNAPAEKAAAAKKRTAKPKAAAASEAQQELPQAGAELQAADHTPATAEQLEKVDPVEKEETDSDQESGHSLSSAETELLAANQKSESADLPEKEKGEVLPAQASVTLEPSASKKAQAASQHRIYVTVKNMGMQAVFEPLSKTSIKPGESVEIGCKSNQFKSEVVNNLQQFIGLGKRLEIKNA